jgi:uncharacterized spore protein YtfJ
MANLLEKVVEPLSSLGVKVSYGEAVTVGGTELIPVALVWLGFGAGSGSEAGDDGSEGSGGGGGGVSVPIGAYVGGGARPSFEPNLIALLALAVPLTWVTGKALSRIIRALKK